jgi:hypothetical protein
MRVLINIMTQFRLTQKFAYDIKVDSLSEPVSKFNVLDDWLIDRLIITRKKVAMVTHAKSLLSFFIPYSDVGGAISIPECIGVLLSEWLYEQDLDKLGEQAIDIFSGKQPRSFCKTVDKKLLGHINDFKRCVGVCVRYLPFEEIDFEDIANKINTMPVTTTANSYSTPERLMLKLLGAGEN